MERLKSALGTEEGRKFRAAVGRAENGSRDVEDKPAVIGILGAFARITEAEKLLGFWRVGGPSGRCACSPPGRRKIPRLRRSLTRNLLL